MTLDLNAVVDAIATLCNLLLVKLEKGNCTPLVCYVSNSIQSNVAESNEVTLGGGTGALQ
jgi:hypothetical protein